MKRRAYTHIVVALAVIVASGACSDQSPVAPNATASAARFAVEDLPGSYVISFLKETSRGLTVAADSEPVETYLVLRSEVRDAVGELATSGSVKYEYCWFAGDYAPSARCDSGSGTWRRHMSVKVDPIGSLAGFGSCSTPRSIGFRFTYTGPEKEAASRAA